VTRSSAASLEVAVLLSDLLGDEVRDSDGTRLGTVVDVRLAVGGALEEDPEAPTLFGIIVSPRTTSSYLGYERTGVRGPAVLTAVLRWRHRGTFLALWSDIAGIDSGAVTLAAGYRRYSPLLRTR
jgi:hypothetical protein